MQPERIFFSIQNCVFGIFLRVVAIQINVRNIIRLYCQDIICINIEAISIIIILNVRAIGGAYSKDYVGLFQRCYVGRLTIFNASQAICARLIAVFRVVFIDVIYREHRLHAGDLTVLVGPVLVDITNYIAIVIKFAIVIYITIIAVCILYASAGGQLNVLCNRVVSQQQVYNCQIAVARTVRAILYVQNHCIVRGLGRVVRVNDEAVAVQIQVEVGAQLLAVEVAIDCRVRRNNGVCLQVVLCNSDLLVVKGQGQAALGGNLIQALCLRIDNRYICGNDLVLLALVVSNGVSNLNDIALFEVLSLEVVLHAVDLGDVVELPGPAIRLVLRLIVAFVLHRNDRYALGVCLLDLVVVRRAYNYPVNVAVGIPVHQLVLRTVADIQSFLNVVVLLDVGIIVLLGDVLIDCVDAVNLLRVVCYRLEVERVVVQLDGAVVRLGVRHRRIVVILRLALDGLDRLDLPVLRPDILVVLVLPSRLAVAALAPQLDLIALDGLNVAAILEGVSAALALSVEVGGVVVNRVSQDTAAVGGIRADDNPSMRLAVGQLSGLVVLVVLVPGTDCCALQAPNGLSQGRIGLNRGAVGGVDQLRAARIVSKQGIVDDLSILTAQCVSVRYHVNAVEQANRLRVGHVGVRIALRHIRGLIAHCADDHGDELSVGDRTVRLKLVVANTDYDVVDVAVTDRGILPGALRNVGEVLRTNVLRYVRVAGHHTGDHCAGLSTGDGVFRMILAVVLTLDDAQVGQHGNRLGVIRARRDILKHLSAGEHREGARERQYHSKNLLQILHRNVSSFLILGSMIAPPLVCAYHSRPDFYFQVFRPMCNISVINCNLLYVFYYKFPFYIVKLF